MSPTLNFSTILALSSLLFEETICLLDTHAFPLNLSNFIIANFCSTPIKWSCFLRAYRYLGSDKHTDWFCYLTLPLHLLVIFPIIFHISYTNP